MSPFETPQSVSHLRRIVQWCSAVRAIRQTCRSQFAKTENPEKIKHDDSYQLQMWSLDDFFSL